MDLLKSFQNWQRANRYNDLVHLGKDEFYDSSSIPRLYVLVRDDILTPIAQGIQAAHAVAQLAATHSYNSETLETIQLMANSYLILLGASEREMLKWAKRRTPDHATYTDIGLVETNGLPVMTAIAFNPMLKSEGEKLFGHLRRAS